LDAAYATAGGTATVDECINIEQEQKEAFCLDTVITAPGADVDVWMLLYCTLLHLRAELPLVLTNLARRDFLTRYCDQGLGRNQRFG
jgi:hypothetical protein